MDTDVLTTLIRIVATPEEAERYARLRAAALDAANGVAHDGPTDEDEAAWAALLDA